MKNRILTIAKLITEDPDIFDMNRHDANLVDASDPGTNGELRQQARTETDNEQVADQLADKKKMEQDLEQQQQKVKQQTIDPQIQELEQAMQKLNVGVLQGKQATNTRNDQFGDLEHEVTNVNQLLQNLQKQF